MQNEIIQVVSTPSWVEIAMFIVTSLYLFATIGVFISNRKMARAAEVQIKTATKMAELSRNVELYDKRIELIEFVDKHWTWEVSESNDFELKLEVLFPNSEALNYLLNLRESEQEIQNCNSEIGVLMKNSKELSISFLSLSEQIGHALKNPTDLEEIARVKKLADDNAVIIDDTKSGSMLYNLFEIMERKEVHNQNCKIMKGYLIEKMKKYIEASISMS